MNLDQLTAVVGGAGSVLLLGLLASAWWKMRVLHELRRIAEALEKGKGNRFIRPRHAGTVAANE